MADLCGDVDVVTLSRDPRSFQSLAKNLFTLASTVSRSGVEVGYSDLNSPTNRRDNAFTLLRVLRRKRIEIVSQPGRSTTKSDTGDGGAGSTEVGGLRHHP